MKTTHIGKVALLVGLYSESALAATSGKMSLGFFLIWGGLLFLIVGIPWIRRRISGSSSKEHDKPDGSGSRVGSLFLIGFGGFAVVVTLLAHAVGPSGGLLYLLADGLPYALLAVGVGVFTLGKSR
jgi:hypothetical protein